MVNFLFIEGLPLDFFNPRSIILFICILQGAIFAALLLIRYFKLKKTADFWLAALLVLLCSSLITPFIGFANVYDRNQWLTYFPFGITYGYSVCIWFYVLTLTNAKRKFEPKDWLLFVPSIVYLIFRFFLFAQSLEFKGYELARYLAKGNLPPYLASRRFVRTVAPQNDLAKYLDTYSKELKSTVRNGVPANIYKKAAGGYFEILLDEETTNYPPVAPDANNFQGKTFIISDASNASATFQFLDYAQRNKLGTIVGQTTGGNKQGINGGNYFFLRLPNSSIEIDVPVYFFAPLEWQKDESVIPDILVKRQPKDAGNNLDRELVTIKNLIGVD